MISVLVGGGGSKGGLLNRAEQMSLSDTIAPVPPPTENNTLSLSSCHPSVPPDTIQYLYCFKPVLSEEL